MRGMTCSLASWVVACWAAAAVAQPSDLTILIELDARRAGDLVAGLDVWSVAPDTRTMEVRVSQAQLDALRDAGLHPVILVPDVYEASARRRAQRIEPAGEEPWTTYHDLEGTYAFLDELHAAHPNTSALFEIGESIEGRPIRGIRLSADASNIDDGRPAILIVGCHHAREWISVEVPLFMAERLLTSYGEDPVATSLLDRGEIWIVPVTNPDGFKYTEIDRFWRKNRRNNGDGTFGVDLNRNYSYEWGHDSGSSGSTSSETYRGTEPFSEPETQAIRDVFLARAFATGVTYHSYRQLVMSPWGYTTMPPPGTVEMEGLVADVASIINGVGNNPNGPYTSGRWGVALYLGSGIFVDWVFGENEVPSVIVELRPRFESQGGFELPEDQILPTCEENYAGAMHLLSTIFFDWCPADCDRSTGNEVLDVLDFVCFQAAFVSESVLADCNQDGQLSILDFVCFQQAFVSGCPWPDG